MLKENDEIYLGNMRIAFSDVEEKTRSPRG